MVHQGCGSTPNPVADSSCFLSVLVAQVSPQLAFPAPPAPADGCAVVCPFCKASLGKDFSLPIHPVLLRQGFDSWKLPDLVALGLSEVELGSLSLYLLYLWTNSDV